jgi:mono/diheme cytochrome c family protein
MLTVTTLVAIIVMTVTLAWLGVRARRAKGVFVKWIGVGLAGLSAAGCVLSGAVIIAGLYKLHSRKAPVPELTVTRAPEQIRRGQAIANHFCASCHSKMGTLSGGYDIGKDFSLPVGSFVTSNLTPAGRLGRWSDGDIFRAIRNSVDANGRWLFVMSLTNAGMLSDDDIKSLIAYIRSVPAAGHESADPPDRLNPLGVFLLGAGMLPKGRPVFTGVISAPAKGPTAEYGAYIVSYQDCRQCHGPNLSGGEGQIGPIGPSLNLVKEWKREEFISTMRTGIDPSGHELDGRVMPWRDIGKLDDEELTALYNYLARLPVSQDTATN